MLRSLTIAAVLLWLCYGASAQSTWSPPDAAADPAARYKLEGIVLNGQTGRPLAHVLISVSGKQALAVLTGTDGRFTFDNLSPSYLSITVIKPGFFLPGTMENNPVYRMVELGPKTGKMEFRLLPESSISGQVTDTDGDPLEGASIQVFSTRRRQGRRQLTRVFRTIRTDEEGNFRFGGLLSGHYYVAVKAMPERATLGSPANATPESYPAIVYYPSAGDLAGASTIDLIPGQKVRVAFALSRVPTFKLAGVVSGISQFKQVSPPMVADEFDEPLLTVAHWDSQTGAFEFSRLPAGTHSLLVRAIDNLKPYPLPFKTPITLDKDVTDFDFSLAPGVTIPVVVHQELGPTPGPHSCSGSFLAQSGVQVDCSRFSATVLLHPDGDGDSAVIAQPLSGDDNSLVLSSVVPGKYVVQVQPMLAGYVASIRCGGADLLRGPLTVSEGNQSPPIDIVLRDDFGYVKVHVRSDKPIGNGRVVLVPQFSPYLRPTDLDVSSTGDREYGLAPGDYKVYAFDSLDGVDYSDADLMQQYAAKAATVTLTPNAKIKVDVDLIHNGDTN